LDGRQIFQIEIMDCENPNCQEAADRAVKKVFAILGVDIDRPESVEEFRQDLRFGKKLRKIADHSTLAFFAVVAVGFASLLWLGIQEKFGKH
jgi:hypothetical protein